MSVRVNFWLLILREDLFFPSTQCQSSVWAKFFAFPLGETERRGGRSVGAALGTKIRDGDTGARGPGGERDRQGAPRPAQRWRHRQTETRARTETRTETRRDGDARSARATPGPTHAEPRAPAPATHRGRRPRGAG